MGTLHEGQCKFFIISCSVIRMRNFQTLFYEEIKTHIMCSTTFFFKSSAFDDIMW
jgi:hypothetical protein